MFIIQMLKSHHQKQALVGVRPSLHYGQFREYLWGIPFTVLMFIIQRLKSPYWKQQVLIKVYPSLHDWQFGKFLDDMLRYHLLYGTYDEALQLTLFPDFSFTLKWHKSKLSSGRQHQFMPWKWRNNLVKEPSLQSGHEFFITESKELKIWKFQNMGGSVQSYGRELQNFSAGEQLGDETKSISKLLFNTSILFMLC